MTLRIGQGFDAHRFAEKAESDGDGQIILGGVSIPHERPLLAHSDGDVVLHSLADALLGALALGDIGHHFPDNDPVYKNADSKELLGRVWGLVSERGFRLVNPDITIIAQAPKMAPHIESMKACIAALLDCGVDRVSVKATTTEKMGFTGRGEGIAVMSVALLERN